MKVWGLLAVALIVRGVVLSQHSGDLDGDSAVFGLMARHILLQGELPIFAWELEYCSSLVAYVAALFFAVGGIGETALWAAALPAQLLGVVMTYRFVARGWDSVTATLAAAVVAVPSGFFLAYTSAPVGGYPEVIGFGMLVLLLTHRWSERARGGAVAWQETALLGGVVGFSLWASHLAIPNAIVAFVVVVLRGYRLGLWRTLRVFVPMVAVGAFPILVYNIIHPLASIKHFGGLALDVSSQQLAGPSAASVLWDRLVGRLVGLPETIGRFLNGLTTLVGAELWSRRPWSFLGAAVAGVYVVAGAAVVRAVVRRRKATGSSAPLVERACTPAGILALLGAASFLFIVALGLARPRHLLPLYPVLAVVLAVAVRRAFVRSRIWAAALAVGILTANVLGLWMEARQPRVNYRALAEELVGRGVTRCYSDYWTAYPVMFYASEEVWVAPVLHTSAVDRTPEYTRRVREASSACYILVDSPKAADIAAEMEARAGTYEKFRVGPFAVYHSVEPPVQPEELLRGG